MQENERVTKRPRVTVESTAVFCANGATIKLIKMSGELALEIAVDDSAIRFPMTQIERAIQSFLNAAHVTGCGVTKQWNIVIRMDGVPLLLIDWNLPTSKTVGAEALKDLLLNPPLSAEAESAPGDDWDLDTQAP